MIDFTDERTLWAILIRIFWPDGAVCPEREQR